MIRTKPLCPRERLLPNWQVFWLTPIPKAFPAIFLYTSGESVSGMFEIELHSNGTVQELHLIPF